MDNKIPNYCPNFIIAKHLDVYVANFQLWKLSFDLWYVVYITSVFIFTWFFKLEQHTYFIINSFMYNLDWLGICLVIFICRHDERVKWDSISGPYLKNVIFTSTEKNIQFPSAT